MPSRISYQFRIVLAQCKGALKRTKLNKDLIYLEYFMSTNLSLVLVFSTKQINYGKYDKLVKDRKLLH